MPDYPDLLGDASGLMRVVVDDGVATIELTRPDKHNAISYAMWTALAALMPALAAADDVEVVMVRGSAGGPFSAGADIGEFRSLRADAEGATRYGAAVEAGERALMEFPKASIAAIEGFAIGGGTQIAVACDLRVCGESSRFAVTPSKLGIVYALQSTARLVEVVGPAWARWILLTGEQVDAATARRIGLVHEVVPDGVVLERAGELARLVSSRAQVSVRGGKALVDRVVAGRLVVDEQVRAIYEQSLHGPEYREGVEAFLAKRPPDFRSARHS